MNASSANESNLWLERFAAQGFVVLKSVVSADLVREVVAATQASLSPLLGPVEYEVDVDYPGGPDREGVGALTPRRLLNAYSRDLAFRRLAMLPEVSRALDQLLDAPTLSQCHHNCVMTKHPGYSSATLWHQDIRYWSFDEPELISAWFALGPERADNGALRVIPGSHRLELDRGRLDRDLFLRTELEENKALIREATLVELEPGDALLFHCRLFHAAGKNLGDTVKLSPVFTYHSSANRPIPGTRSDRLPGIEVDLP